MPRPSPPRDHTPLKIWHPTINNVPITSIPHLHTLLTTDYPGLQTNPNYPAWRHDAETHLTLIQLLKNKTHLQRGDRQRLANKLGITRQKFTAWTQDGRQPRLYYELTRSLSKPHAHTTITQLHHDNNGLHATHDVIHRLTTYYLTPLHAQSPHHHQRLHQCTLYFQTLNLLKDGGTFLDIARELNIHHSQIQRWLDGQRPDYIELSRHIPSQEPNPSNKWLPLKLKRAFVPTNFIQVPVRIKQHPQIVQVLKKLKPLETKKMQKWKHRFGPIDQESAFYYLLGLIISDFDKPSHRTSSTELILNLSKKYTWSEQVGEASCYYLAQIGIKTQKDPDRDSSAGPKTCHSWRSQKSPFITWIIQSALGLQPKERTTYHAIRANWILNAPRSVRIAILQGLNDGDGWASIKDQCIGNACQPNISFFRNLLQTFGIASTDDKQRVRVRSQNGIIKLTELPAFRHATERQQNADKITKMMRVRKQQKTSMLKAQVKDLMMKLHNEGISNGSIAEIIFDRFNISFHPRTVSRQIKLCNERFRRTKPPDR